MFQAATAAAAERPRSLRYCRPYDPPPRAQLDAFRLGVHQRDLRGREQDALARLGKMTLGEGGARVGRLATLATEAAAIRSRLDALSGERRSSGAAAHGDLERRRQSLEQKLRELHLVAGRLAMAMPATDARAKSSRSGRSWRTPRASASGSAPKLGGSARTSWPGSRWLTPRAPALAAMALGWWMTSRYTSRTSARS